MTVVGLTGSIASGKSTVAAIFGELGATVLSADEVVARLEQPSGAAFARIVAHFGKEVLNSSGELDRAALARRVFFDAAEREALEQIIHPLVHEELTGEIEHRKACGDELIVIEIPLLFEVNGKKRYGLDAVVVVDASEETSLRRLKTLRHLDDEMARRRLSALAPSKARLDAADVVIVNDGTLDELREEVRHVYARLVALDHQSQFRPSTGR